MFAGFYSLSSLIRKVGVGAEALARVPVKGGARPTWAVSHPR